jgi:hypothetical protein
MKYLPDEKSVTAFIEWFEREEKDNYLHFLEWMVLNSHLGLYMCSSPIDSMSPIAASVYRAIEKHSPQKNPSDIRHFYYAVQKKLHEEGHMERHLKFRPPHKRN